jgi:membrane protease YdiL (CAAX protease family)
MLSVKPWKPDAVVRLILGMFSCLYAGTLVLTALYCAKGHAAKFFPLAGVAWCLLAAVLFLVRKPWPLENLILRMVSLLGCFYGGLVVGSLAQKLAGAQPPEGTVTQMLAITLSFQGAGLGLMAFFVREHRVSCREVFGLRNRPLQAAMVGLLVACLFLPVAISLMGLSAEVMTRLSRMQPEVQLPVRILSKAVFWPDRAVLGLITIFLVPASEEALFRGILYPAIKQAGFPRLAFWGTAVLFGAVHLSLTHFLALFVLALVLTALYEWTDNLLAPIAAHSAFNALNFIQLCLQQL